MPCSMHLLKLLDHKNEMKIIIIYYYSTNWKLGPNTLAKIMNWFASYKRVNEKWGENTEDIKKMVKLGTIREKPSTNYFNYYHIQNGFH